MIVNNYGRIVLISVPEGDKRGTIIQYLGHIFKQTHQEKIVRAIQKLPLVLSPRIREKTGKRMVMNLEKLGARASFEPESGTEKIPGRGTDQPIKDLILDGFTEKFSKKKPSFLYLLGLLLVAVVMAILVIVYIGIIALVTFALCWHVTNNHTVFQTVDRTIGAILLFGSPILIGVILIFFMLKPFFARHVQREFSLKVDRKNEPLLYDFVERVAQSLCASVPCEINVDMQVNASAAFKNGLRGLIRRDLVLTVGLPLVYGLSIKEFAGVLAHELGHFAQGAGMSLSYMIRTINYWFMRVVYEEDQWDERIRAWSRQWDIRLAIILMTARCGVWVNRKILWLLMIIGHLTSCFMLRQMEFDADRHEISMAGSAAFASATKSFATLSLAYHHAGNDLGSAWNEERLPDDFPGLVLENRSQIQPEVLKNHLDAVMKARTRLFGTHPSVADRVSKAEKMGAKGTFLPNDDAKEITASALLQDPDGLARETSIGFYQRLFNVQITAEHLVDTKAISRAQNIESVFSEALDRYFLGQFHVLRPLGIREKHIFDPTIAQKTTRHLGQARRMITGRAFNQARLLKRFDDHRDRTIRLSRARALVDAGVEFDPATFNLKSGDEASIESAHSKTNSQLNELCTELDFFEKYCRIRLVGALGILSHPKTAGKIPQSDLIRGDARKLVRLLAIMEGSMSEIDQFQTEFEQFHILASFCDDPENPPELILEKAIEMQGELRKIRDQFRSVPYPFQHSQNDLTLGDFLVGAIPGEKEVETLLSKAHDLLNGYYQVYYRLAGRLACMAELIETNLGLSPLKGTVPKMEWRDLSDTAKEENASSKPRDQGADKGLYGNVMAEMLKKTRLRFGLPRRYFSFFQRRYNHMTVPRLIRLGGNGEYGDIYRDQNLLMCEGKVVWAHIVQANSLLFEPGKTDRPAAVVFSLDHYFDRNSAELESIAHSLYGLKGETSEDPELKAFADAIRNERTILLNKAIPKPFTGGRPVFYTTIWVCRKHLPVDYLKSTWFPFLTLPAKTRTAMILPAKYWDDGLLDCW